MKFKRFFMMGAFLALSATVFAQEINFSGNLTTQAGVGLPNTHDNKGKFLLGQTIFDGTMKSYIDESMVYVNGQFIHDAIATQSTNGYSSFVSDDGTFAFRLKEAYMDWKSGLVALRIGRQIAAWGKADDIQIADILCPKDESSIIATEYKNSRLPIDAARLSVLTDSTQIDAYWIPFFTPSMLPLAKKNPLRAYMLPDDADGIPLNTPQTYMDFDMPEKKLCNSEFALRASAYTSIADLSFYGFYGWDDMPFIKYSGNLDEEGEICSIDVRGEYKRMSMIGVDAAIPAGDFVLRFEGAFFPQRYIQTTTEYQEEQQANGNDPKAGLRRNQLLALAGFDWTPTGGWTITAQYCGDYVFNHKDKLDRKQYQHQATLSIEKTLMNENLTLMASGSLDLRDLASASELEVEYKLTDSILLSAIGDFFLEGPDDKKGMFGEYHDLSSVTLKAKIAF